MLGKSREQRQGRLLVLLLEDFIDMSHELVLLAKKIDWAKIEKELSVYIFEYWKAVKGNKTNGKCVVIKEIV